MATRLALIFDVDGTLADTESAHRDAFNAAFTEEGLPFQWSEAEYTRLLEVAGGPERIAAYLREREAELPALLAAQDVSDLPGLIARIHRRKTRFYTERIGQGQVPLRPGVQGLLQEGARRGVALALATTTTPANIDALLRVALGPGWRAGFAFVADASTAPRKKPDPQVYLQVLAALGRPPDSCLAFEDSHNGLRAARAAGLRTIITPTAFTARDDFTGAALVLPDLSTLQIDDLEALIARA